MSATFTQEDLAVRVQLRSLAQGLTLVPIEEYLREKTLGLQGGFGEYRGEVERIRSLASRVASVDFDLIPFEHLKPLQRSLSTASQALDRMHSFGSGARPGERENIGVGVKSAAQDLFIQTAPVLAVAMVPDAIIQRVEAEAKRISAEWEERIGRQHSEVETTRKEVEAISHEASEALEAARAAAGDEGIAAQSRYFDDQAAEHNKAGGGWLLASIVLLGSILVFASQSMYYYMDNPPETGKPTNVQLLVAKVVLFSALFTGLIAAIRSYRAHRHNYVVNKHRHNALRTFRAFSAAETDEATKSAVLLQATKCIFSPQVTAYSAEDVDSGFSPLIEIVRNVVQKRD